MTSDETVSFSFSTSNEALSDKRLAEIAARANAATPGPWTWSPGMIEAPGTDEHFGSEIILWAGNIPGEYDDDDAAAALGACGLRAENDAAANLEFLAAAREDVPALLAEVERLRGERSAFVELLGSLWLYVKWHFVTRQLTTPQKELFADAVDADVMASQAADGDEPHPVAERWWRDDYEAAP